MNNATWPASHVVTTFPKVGAFPPSAPFPFQPYAVHISPWDHPVGPPFRYVAEVLLSAWCCFPLLHLLAKHWLLSLPLPMLLTLGRDFKLLTNASCRWPNLLHDANFEWSGCGVKIMGQTPLALSSQKSISYPARNRSEQMPLLGCPDGWVAAKGMRRIIAYSSFHVAELIWSEQQPSETWLVKNMKQGEEEEEPLFLNLLCHRWFSCANILKGRQGAVSSYPWKIHFPTPIFCSLGNLPMGTW